MWWDFHIIRKMWTHRDVRLVGRTGRFAQSPTVWWIARHVVHSMVSKLKEDYAEIQQLNIPRPIRHKTNCANRIAFRFRRFRRMHQLVNADYLIALCLQCLQWNLLIERNSAPSSTVLMIVTSRPLLKPSIAHSPMRPVTKWALLSLQMMGELVRASCNVRRCQSPCQFFSKIAIRNSRLPV